MKKRVLSVILAAMLICSSGLISASSVNDPETKADGTKFTMWMELYDREQMMSESAPPGDIEPLAPLELEVGQEIQLAVRYSGLSHMNSSGIQNLAFSFDYNANYLDLQEFGIMDLDIGVSEMDSPDELYRWVPASLQSYLPSASVRTTEEEGIYRVYLQYIADSERTEVLREEDAIVGVFTFTVLAPIAVSKQVFFSWTDYLVSFYGPDGTDLNTYENYSKARFTDSENFEPPQDLQIATSDAVETGVTVSGQVRSYAPAKAAKIYLVKGEENGNSITYPIFRDDDRVIVEDNVYAAVDSSVVDVSDNAAQDGEQHEQTFTFNNVEVGTYMLIVTKQSHADYTIKGIEVSNNNIDLTRHSNANVQLMTLIAGDLDESGMVDAADLAILVSTRNYDSETPENAASNIDGIGSVDAADLAILISARNYDVDPVEIEYK